MGCFPVHAIPFGLYNLVLIVLLYNFMNIYLPRRPIKLIELELDYEIKNLITPMLLQSK